MRVIKINIFKLLMWAVIIIAGIVLLLSTFVEGFFDSLVKQYVSMTDKRTNSKSDFNKVLYYIELKPDGTQTMVLSSTQQISKEQIEKALEESGATDFTFDYSNNTVFDDGSIDVSIMNYYDQINVPAYDTKAAKCEIIDGSGVYAYPGNPFDNFNDGNWYMLNLQSVSAYYKRTLDRELKFDTAYHTDDVIKESRIIEGVTCMPIAWTPAFAMCDFTLSGGFQDYGETRCAQYYGLVWVTKTDADGTELDYFIPIATGTCSTYNGTTDTCKGYDNKGHTWPGGFCQTYIANGTTVVDGKFDVTNDDGGTLKYTNSSGVYSSFTNIKGTPVSEIKNIFKTITYDSNMPIVNAGHPKLTLELPSRFVTALSNQYAIKGYIIHKP